MKDCISNNIYFISSAFKDYELDHIQKWSENVIDDFNMNITMSMLNLVIAANI